MPFDYPEAGGQPPASGTTPKEATVLKSYKAKVNGYETTLMLSDEDARRQGLLKDKPEAKNEPEAKQAPKPANKARRAPNKAKS